MTYRFVIALGVVLGLGGCANFKAVSEFAQQTTNVTSVVKTEFTDLDAVCREQAEVTIIVNNIEDDGPLKTCAGYRASQGRLAAVTVDVLDNYGRALRALADNTNFDLGSDIETLGGKVQSLKDSAGNSLVSAAEITALTKVVQLIAGIVTEAKREAAVGRMVQEKENLAITGRILRSYFVKDPQAPPGRSRAPYVNQVGLISDSFAATDRKLKSGPFQKAEPIRTVELLRASRGRQTELARRTAQTPDSVPASVASAIDAWLAALDKFGEDALKPDPKEFRDRLKDLRTKVSAAREAIDAARNP